MAARAVTSAALAVRRATSAGKDSGGGERTVSPPRVGCEVAAIVFAAPLSTGSVGRSHRRISCHLQYLLHGYRYRRREKETVEAMAKVVVVAAAAMACI